MLCIVNSQSNLMRTVCKFAILCVKYERKLDFAVDILLIYVYNFR